MAKKIEETKDQSIFEAAENSLSKTEQYIEENQKSIGIVLAVVIAIALGYLGFQKYYLQPIQDEAASSMFAAEQYFAKDSFALALDGDDAMPGFLEIIEDYGSTDAGNLAYYYAGVCQYKLGEYQEAIDLLESFSGDDQIVYPTAIGLIGDAYAELEEFDNAISNYKTAAASADNEFLSPINLMKAACLLEEDGNYTEALELYTSIKKNYPKSNEARSISKYIAKAKIKAGE